jgi:hypothetical protein
MYTGTTFGFIYVFNITEFLLVFTNVSHPEPKNVNDNNCQSQTNFGNFPNKYYIIVLL